jgi:hypothetical protein
VRALLGGGAEVKARRDCCIEVRCCRIGLWRGAMRFAISVEVTTALGGVVSGLYRLGLLLGLPSLGVA